MTPRKRGRVSAAELEIRALKTDDTVVSLPAPEPPAELSEEEAALWSAIIAAFPIEHFTTEVRPLLSAFVQHTVHAQHLKAQIAEVQAYIDGTEEAHRLTIAMDQSAALDKLERRWARQTKAASDLSMRLRIAPQALTRSEATRRPASGLKPWEYVGEEET